MYVDWVCSGLLLCTDFGLSQCSYCQMILGMLTNWYLLRSPVGTFRHAHPFLPEGMGVYLVWISACCRVADIVV